MRNYRLNLIRHGLTEGNLLGQYLGSGTDSPLCQEGVDRLVELREKFVYPKVDKLYVSPMKEPWKRRKLYIRIWTTRLLRI